MMTERTPRLALPLLQPGQAQKEMSHNEALARLDLVVQGTVVAADANVPPSTPAAGEAWILGSAPTGAWSSHSLSVAGWTDSGWIFIEPAPGMQFWVIAEAAPATFVEGMWRLGEVRGKVFVEGDQVVGPRAASIAEPTAGTTVDAEARAAIVSVLEVLRGHGLIESD